MAKKVPPLRSRTMTLDELQRQTLSLIKKLRKQFYRPHYGPGLSDAEFLEEVADPLWHKILADREIIRTKQQKEISRDAL